MCSLYISLSLILSLIHATISSLLLCYITMEYTINISNSHWLLLLSLLLSAASLIERIDWSICLWVLLTRERKKVRWLEIDKN